MIMTVNSVDLKPIQFTEVIQPSQLVQVTLAFTDDTQLPLLEDWLWTLTDLQSVDTNFEGPLGQQTIKNLKLVFALHASVNVFQWQQQLLTLLSGAPVSSQAKPTIQQVEVLQDDDWAESWKQHWSVTPVSQTLLIVPSWQSYQPTPEQLVIKLDPGQAFGTGTHPTTRLMLQQLEKLRQEQDFSQISALDVGCGSGVLAIGAALMGVPSVIGTDIQPESAIATIDNAKLNGVTHQITASTTPLQDLCQTKHELVLANIIAPVINELLEDMLLRLENDSGRLLLSGLIEPNVVPLIERLESYGLTINEVREDGEWRLIDAGY